MSERTFNIMNLNCKTLLGLTALTVSGLAANPASAGITLTSADSNVGTAGAPSSGTLSDTGSFNGFGGGPGYEASGFNSPSYIVNGPVFTGGLGGATTGNDAAITYQGGSGGSGLQTDALSSNTAVTINSGTFTGGLGGPADGLGSNLIGGYGGSGLLVADFSTTVSADVYGGIFVGGDSGAATGTGNFSSDPAGSGVDANENSVVNIFGGTFTGGNQNAAGNGGSGAGLVDLGGILNVYGGTFKGGNGGASGHGIDVYIGTTTLYGTNFFVNGVAAPNGPVTGTGTITGTLLDNTGATTLTYQVIGGSLNLSSTPVPEASAAVSLGLLIALGFGGFVVGARRRMCLAQA